MPKIGLGFKNKKSDTRKRDSIFGLFLVFLLIGRKLLITKAYFGYAFWGFSLKYLEFQRRFKD